MYNGGEGMDASAPGLTVATGGQSVTGTLVTQARDKQVSMQQVFPEAGEYTIQFSMDLTDVPVVLYCEADIEWSVGGNVIRRRITVNNGTSISGNGEGVRVVIRDASPIAVVPENFDYKVSATVARGARGIFTNPPVLEILPDSAGVTPVQDINGGAFFTYTIPQMVGVKALKVEIGSVAGAAIPDQGIQVRFLDQTGGIDLTRFDPRDYEWWPVPAAARFIRIENRTGAQIIGVLPIYGIDG